jgi:type IV pilus assembly protein PilC
MATYTYTAKDASGKKVTGSLVADSRQEAMSSLHAQNLVPTDLAGGAQLAARPTHTTKKPGGWFGGGGTVSLNQKAVFCRQLAISVNAGVSLRESLESIASDEEHPPFRRVQDDIIEKLHAGKTFSEALTPHTRVFSPLFVALVRAAEEAGSLPETLNELANTLERSEKLASRIRSITAYPLFVAVFFTIVCAIMTIFVLPRFQSIFEGFNAKLPLITRIVFGANRLAIHYLPVALVVLGLVLAGLTLYARTTTGRAHIDGFKLRIPFFGTCLRKYAVSRFCRNLAIMVRGGVPVVTAMEMSAATSGNKAVEQAFMRARERVMGGASMASSMEGDKMFPRMVVRMVNVGESAGRLPEVLEKVADMYDDQVEAAIMVATSLFEPVIICVFGAVVLVLVLAIYVPVFTIAGNTGS